MTTLFFPGPSPASSVPPTDVADRSTTFQPVEGGTEHHSGETLVVAAYAGLWLVMMVWVLIQWRKQNALARRIDELEAVVSRAAKADTMTGLAPAAAEAKAQASAGRS